MWPVWLREPPCLCHLKAFAHTRISETIWSIMSGDSPNTHQTDIFDFKEGRSSPAPTTSKDSTVHGGEVVQASVLVEPDKDKDKEDESKDLNSPILNNSSQDERRQSDADQTVQVDELNFSGKDKDRREKRKLNGDLDKLDGVWVPSREPRKDVKSDDDDDNCTVKCLYYTMQCCECTIM